MTCPKCQTKTVSLGMVECRTGNAEKRACTKCKGIWFEQTEYHPNFAELTPLRTNLERVARLALATV